MDSHVRPAFAAIHLASSQSSPRREIRNRNPPRKGFGIQKLREDMADLRPERGEHYVGRRAHAALPPSLRPAKPAKKRLRQAAAMQEEKVPKNRANASAARPPAAKAATCMEKVENVVSPPHSPTRWNFSKFGRRRVPKSA